MARTYENFDVELIASGATYEAIFHSIPGEPRVSFGFPLEDHELTAFLAMFGKDQRRRMESPEFIRARAVGRRLFDSLFPGELSEMLLQATHQAQGRNRGLRIRLDLSEAQDLGTLPWEYLHSTYNEDFVSLSNWTPLVRYLDVADPLPATPLEGPLRILVMVSDPIERRGTLDVEREWDQLKLALQRPETAGEIEIARLPNGQLETLMFDLQDNEYHVFHFIGHGEYSEQHDDGVLAFEDARGREVHVPGGTLGTYLRDSIKMRLVVLNNCEGAAFETDPFTGSAQSLLRKGIPAIVAMQFEITDRAAIDFARGFYTSLGKGFPVDAALAEARKVIRAGPTRIEFGSPVLYMSAHDGVLFTRSNEVEIPSEDDQTDVVRPLTVKHETPSPAEPVDEPTPAPVTSAAPADQEVVSPPPGPAKATPTDAPVERPETTEPETPSSPYKTDAGDRTRRGSLPRMWIGAVVAVIAGVVVLFTAMSGTDDGNGSTSAQLTSTTTGQETTISDSETTSPTAITPPVNWSRVPQQASLGGAGGQVMFDVTEADGVWVAVGAEVADGQARPSAWTSDNGEQWIRRSDGAIETGGAETAEMRSVVGFDSGLVAFGWVQAGNDTDAAVWTSEDGSSWMRVSSEALEGPGAQEIRGVTLKDTGELVAVGWVTTGGNTDGAVWASSNGVDWERMPDPTGSFSGPEVEQIHDVASRGSTLVAVGSTGTDTDRNIAVWLSIDETTWELLDAETAGLTGSGDYLANSISPGPEGFLVGGYETVAAHRDAALWLSADGENWERVSGADAFGGPFDQEVHALGQIGSSWVAAGWTHPSEGDKDASAWVSEDGRSWQQAEQETSSFGGDGDQQIESLAVLGSELVAVGIDADNVSSPETFDAAVWLGAR